MRDDQWQQAFDAGRAEAEGLVEALEAIIADVGKQGHDGYYDGVLYHTEVDAARTALAKYREGR